jgi:hypothetical protein
MARQAMGKGKMGKVEVADLEVNAGSTIVSTSGKKFTVAQTIVAVYVTNNNAVTTFTFDGAVYTTDNANVQIV